MADSLLDGFLYELCNWEDDFKRLFTLTVVIAVLMLLWAPFVKSGTGTRVIVLMNLVLAVLFSVFFGIIILLCRHR